MVCLSYVGEDAFDIVLYTGRTLTKLNHRVLIIDRSDSSALFKSIYHGMDLNSNETIVNHRDINYTRKVPSEEELKAFEAGVVFIVYGYNSSQNFTHPCVETNVVVNTYPHVIDKVNSLMSNLNDSGKITRLLIKDITNIDELDRVKSELTFTYEDDDYNYLYHDIADYESAINCEVKQIVSFVNISGRMEKHIIGHIQRIFPQINLHYIKKALKTARKGM